MIGGWLRLSFQLRFPNGLHEALQYFSFVNRL